MKFCVPLDSSFLCSTCHNQPDICLGTTRKTGFLSESKNDSEKFGNNGCKAWEIPVGISASSGSFLLCLIAKRLSDSLSIFFLLLLLLSISCRLSEDVSRFHSLSRDLGKDADERTSYLFFSLSNEESLGSRILICCCCCWNLHFNSRSKY